VFELAEDRERLLPLLLLADEDETVVCSYIDEGELFAIRDGDQDIGVLLLTAEGNVVEIKNLALDEEHQGKGLGREAVEFAKRRARELGAERLVVGTADAARDTVAFHEHVGFRRTGIRAGFFDAYPTEIWIDGVKARDMVMFEMEL